MQGDGGIMMRSDYPEEQGLKEDFVYPWYERVRKKREVTSTDEEPPTGKVIFTLFWSGLLYPLFWSAGGKNAPPPLKMSPKIKSEKNPRQKS